MPWKEIDQCRIKEKDENTKTVLVLACPRVRRSSGSVLSDLQDVSRHFWKHPHIAGPAGLKDVSVNQDRAKGVVTLGGHVPAGRRQVKCRVHRRVRKVAAFPRLHPDRRRCGASRPSAC